MTEGAGQGYGLVRAETCGQSERFVGLTGPTEGNKDQHRPGIKQTEKPAWNKDSAPGVTGGGWLSAEPLTPKIFEEG